MSLLTVEERERDKYHRIWQFDEYRRGSPGEQFLAKTEKIEADPKVKHVHDYGCGTGRALPHLRRLFPNACITQFDFAENCRDEGYYADRFVNACLWDMPDVACAEFGICMDVIEHIPEEYVEDVLESLSKSCKRLLLQGSMVHDNWGPTLIGEELHLTQRPWEWWEPILRDRFTVEWEHVPDYTKFTGVYVPR